MAWTVKQLRLENNWTYGMQHAEPAVNSFYVCAKPSLYITILIFYMYITETEQVELVTNKSF